MEIEPKYFEHPDLSIRCIEWHAFRSLCMAATQRHCEAFPIWTELDAMARRIHEKGEAKSKRSNAAVNDGKHQSLDECYEAIARL